VACALRTSYWVALPLVIASVLGSASTQTTSRRVIQADNPPKWGSDVRLARTFSLGTLDGPAEYALGIIELFAARSDGTFCQYDSKNTQIRCYDGTGRFVRKVGRAGDGPGEYKKVMGLGLLGDSLLLVWDVRLRRLSLFDAGGRFVSSRNLSGSAPGMFGSNVFGVDSSGILYFQALDPTAHQANGESAFTWTLISSNGNKLSAFRQWDENTERGSFGRATVDGSRSNFHSKTVTALYPPGGFVYGRNDQFEITVVDAKRADTLVIRRTSSRVPLRTEERREWDALASEVEKTQRRRAPNPRVKISTPLFEALATPSLKPVFRSLFADYDGRIWVEMYVAAEKGDNSLDPPVGNAQLTWREPTVFEVLARDGSFLGRVRVPTGAKVLAARDSSLWLLETGPDGEQLIRSYRIMR
jgi:hypothetical protein